MGNIIIAAQLIKKRKWSLFILMIEVIISSIVLVGIIGQCVHIKNVSNISKVFNGIECFYFTPFDYYSPNFQIEEQIDDSGIEIASINMIQVNEDDSESFTSFTACSDLIIDRLEVNMDKGEWFGEKHIKTDYIPVVSIGDNFKVGDIIQVKKYSCQVIGCVKNDEYMISLNSGASNGDFSIGRMISDFSGHKLIIPYRSEKYTCFKEEDISFIIPESSRIIRVDESVKDELTDKLKQYGTISSIQEMNQNYSDDNYEFGITNGILLLVFVLLTLVGIGGMNGIYRAENSKYYTILYMLGLDSKRCMIVEAINSFAVIGISYGVFIVVYKLLFPDIIPSDVTNRYGWIYICVFLYLLVLYLITSLGGIKSVSNRNIIELYRE